MINTNYNSSFPSQVVSNAEKASLEYGEMVGRAIEGEWFGSTRSANNRFITNFNNFHSLRLYARGEQPIQKYKDVKLNQQGITKNSTSSRKVSSKGSGETRRNSAAG